MLERVLEFREQTGFIQEPRGLEICEISAEITSPVIEGLKQDDRHVLSDNSGRLQQALCLGRESIDPPGEQRLHRCWHSDRRDVRRQAVRASFTGEDSGLHQGPHGLFEEERVALGLIDQQTLERRNLGNVTHQSPQELLGALRGQRVDSELTIVSLTSPGVSVFGSVVDEKQDGRPRQAVHKAVQQRLRLWVDPVKVLQHHNERLDLALAAQQAFDRIKSELAALWRLQVPQAIPLRQGVQKPENGRKQILECFIEGQQMSSGLGANRADVVTLVDSEQSFQKINDGQIRGGSAI